MTSFETRFTRLSSRSLLLMLLVLTCFGQTGCGKSFVARNVYFDTTNSPGRYSEVAVVALSDAEWRGLVKSEVYSKNALERKTVLDEKLQKGEWRNRSVKRDLDGKKPDNRLLSAQDSAWSKFRSAKDANGDPADWLVVIVVQTNWRDEGEQDRWFASYRGGPEDALPEGMQAVYFGWVEKTHGPEIISTLSVSGT